MSLSARVVLLVMAILAAVVAATGGLVYGAARRSHEAADEARLASRLVWIEAALEWDEPDLDLEPGPDPEGTAEDWCISMRDGRVLWGSPVTGGKAGAPYRALTRDLVFGDRSADPVPSSAMVAQEPGSMPHGFVAGGDGGRVDLVLAAGTSIAATEVALGRLSRALWTVAPAALVCSGILLSLLVRSQLRPLAVMAREAQGIGPGDEMRRIGEAGSSSECVALRESINGMIDRLAEALRKERRFSSFAAHELRTPVAQLRTQVEVALRKDRPTEEYRAALKECLADVARLEGLVQGLLRLTRAEGKDGVRRDPMDLRALLDRVARRHGLTLSGEALAAAQIPSSGDEPLLEVALSNVLDNAARYAPGSPPEISVARGAEGVQIQVADRGPGIPADCREKVFEPLFRLDAARTVGDAPEGYGLGLAVARSAMRAMGGDLSCRPRADGASGAEFVFALRG